MLKRCTGCGKEKDLTEFYRRRRRGKEDLCPRCKGCHNEAVRIWQSKNKEKLRKIQYKWKKRNWEKVKATDQKVWKYLFGQCLNHYGHFCSLCGSTKNLCMDHIGGNRKESPYIGPTLWRWIIKNKFPEGFRTLCQGCNARDGLQRRKEREEKYAINNSDN